MCFCEVAFTLCVVCVCVPFSLMCVCVVLVMRCVMVYGVCLCGSCVCLGVLFNVLVCGVCGLAFDVAWFVVVWFVVVCDLMCGAVCVVLFVCVLVLCACVSGVMCC